MLASDILARQEKFTRAQFWLRRADQVAPDDQRRDFAVQSYRQLARRNPLRVQLSFSVRPSDNINNGTNPDAVADFGGLPLSGTEPLEGFEAAFGMALSYRLSEDERQRTAAILQFYGRKVFISQSELNKITDGDESDYDYASLFVGLQHSRLIFDDLGPTHGTFRIGSSYFERSLFANTYEFSLAQDIKLSESNRLRFGLVRKDEHRIESDAASSLTHSVSVDYFQRNEGGNSWSLGLKLEDIDAISGGVNGRQLEASLRYAWSQEFWGMRPDILLRGRFRDYPDFQIEPRMDRSIYATLGLTLVDLNYFGFQPRLEATFAKSNSNIDIFDSDALGIGFNLVSRF